MNKAFVREPDTSEVNCPLCGGIGEEVQRVTIESHVPPDALRPLAATAYFCPTPSCLVAYFDAFETTVATGDLKQPIFPKDASAPLCPCFGLTREDVEADIADGTPRRIRELLTKSKSSAARCQTAAPTGRCCLPDVQKYYFKLRGGV